MPVKSADGKEYEYIVVDDYSRAVYARPLRHKSEAPEAFKVFKAAAENESQKKVREVMDNVREICMGEIRDIIWGTYRRRARHAARFRVTRIRRLRFSTGRNRTFRTSARLGRRAPSSSQVNS